MDVLGKLTIQYSSPTSCFSKHDRRNNNITKGHSLGQLSAASNFQVRPGRLASIPRRQRSNTGLLQQDTGASGCIPTCHHGCSQLVTVWDVKSSHVHAIPLARAVPLHSPW